MLVLVTLCTNRKRRSASPLLQAGTLPIGPQERAFVEWRRRVLSCSDRQPAKTTYCGRGFAEALAVAHTAGASLWIISAGLGLIAADQAIPAYDLTLSTTSPNSIRTRITPTPFCPARWWRQLNEAYKPGRSLAELVQTHPNATVVITLSSSYVALVTADLATLPPSAHCRVRLIGLVSAQGLPPALQPLWMEYDSRFDGPDSPNPGTRADFPQRATRHFLEKIAVLDPVATPEQHRTWVMEALAVMRPAVVPRRQHLDDPAILALITQHWSHAGGSASRMLRLLRDKDGVACEQGRLSRLFKQVKQHQETISNELTDDLDLKFGNVD